MTNYFNLFLENKINLNEVYLFTTIIQGTVWTSITINTKRKPQAA